MHIRCRDCGVDMAVPARAEGKRLRCPECGREFICELPQGIILDEPAGNDEEIVLIDELTGAAAPESEFPLAEEVIDPLEWASPETPLAEEALADMAPAKPDYIVKENPRRWHVMVGGIDAVALTWEQLKQRAAAGDIRPRTELWYAPKDITLQARDLPGLFGPAEPAPVAAEAEAEAEDEGEPVTDAAVDEEAAALAAALGDLDAGSDTIDPADALAEGATEAEDDDDSK